MPEDERVHHQTVRPNRHYRTWQARQPRASTTVSAPHQGKDQREARKAQNTRTCTDTSQAPIRRKWRPTIPTPKLVEKEKFRALNMIPPTPSNQTPGTIADIWKGPEEQEP
ncbi:hypothetical protein NDU88_007047 [Pleurodeles waltl]|uniref:Uncharacterized protein n=1 Tax=Pleurodeles waltl TaxID=8319 RepID=A0AAV7N2X9_PLEWA|nr:hypothetical protein NDU88_007047 [Pleurodeles waltl]